MVLVIRYLLEFGSAVFFLKDFVLSMGKAGQLVKIRVIGAPGG